MNTGFTQRVALKMLHLLMQNKALHYTAGIVFYIWQRGDRLIVAFDPSAIRLERINDQFVHTLSTRLEGRRVVRTNTRGLFLQVGIEIPRAQISLDEPMPLDLTQQPSPWHLPVGMTQAGPLWIPLMGGISFLIGGSTGMGKTGEEHAWIQALLHGGKTLVYAWDGKHSVEFIRYADQPNFHLMIQMDELEQLQSRLHEREMKLAQSGYVNILMHNDARPDDFIPPIALFVDEAADLPDSAKLLLKQMIRIYRYVGLYPIIATNQPTQAEMFAKTNLSTRLAYRVPHHNDSITILGSKGAETLPDVIGRGLIIWRGRLVEFQSFQVTYPAISEEARQLMSTQVDAEQEPNPAQDEIFRLADSIREQWTPEMSGRAVGELLGKPYGGSWHKKINEIIEYLRATTATATTNTPDLGLEPA